jgi:ribosomal protein S18 acetylase RimI-like enzyme
MGLTFRPVSAADFPVLLAHMSELYAQDKIPFDPARARAALSGLVADPTLGRALGIWLDGTIVGYVILTFGYSLEYGGRDAFIDELFISEPFRNQGLGTAAIEFAANLCRSEAIQALHLEVDHTNPRAHALYRRAGFEDHERHLMTRRLT